MRVYYSSNNSGGDWWLKDKDWKNLEKAGWEVGWFRDDPFIGEKRFLGGLAGSAYAPEGMTEKEAIEQFESITGQNTEAPGCSCCGQPHYFYENN